jgi:hypothetical protein
MQVEVEVELRPTLSRPVCHGVGLPSGAHDQIFGFCLCGFLEVGRPLWREDGSVIYYCCCWASPAQSLSGLSLAGLNTLFHCSSFLDSPILEDQVPVFISLRNRVAQLYPQELGSLFIASYNSQGYGGGILSHLHTRKEMQVQVQVQFILRPTVNRSVRLGVGPPLLQMTRF